jgi:hypothetical protein
MIFLLTFLCFVAIITSVACNDDSDCSVDDNSQCDTTNGKCVCKLGFAITGTKCERKSNRDVSDNILFIICWILFRLFGK